MINFSDLSCKFRFALSRLPYLPVKYKLKDKNRGDLIFWWSKVMPYFNRKESLLNFDIWGWDSRELLFLNKYLKPGMVFLDIGAYHGLYSIIASRRVIPNGKVFAFEPNPSDYKRMRLHFYMNKINNTSTLNLALSDSKGNADFYIPSSGIKTISGFKPAEYKSTKHKKISVNTISLDKFFEQNIIEKINLIKVDIEGAEKLFLKGATNTINQYRPLLILEAIDIVCESWGYKPSEILNYLRNNFDYTLFEFTEKGYITYHNIKEYYPETSNCNILAVPSEEVGKIGHIIQ